MGPETGFIRKIGDEEREIPSETRFLRSQVRSAGPETGFIRKFWGGEREIPEETRFLSERV